MLLTNRQLAERLRERANRLAQEGGNVYRVRALRRAAMAVLGLPWEATVALTSAKRHKLSSVPGIGPGVVRLLRQWLSQPLAATDGDGQQPAMLSGD